MADYERLFLTPQEEEKLKTVYDELKALANVKVPSVRSNCRMALAHVWQAMNAECLLFEHITCDQEI